MFELQFWYEEAENEASMLKKFAKYSLVNKQSVQDFEDTD